MTENEEPPRLELADMWPGEGLGPIAENLPEEPRRIVKPAVERQRCELCKGDVMRSRVRFYERPCVMWSRMRPDGLHGMRRAAVEERAEKLVEQSVNGRQAQSSAAVG